MNQPMKQWLAWLSLALIVAASASATLAQEQEQPGGPAEAMALQEGAPMDQMDQMGPMDQTGQATPEMREMARSMKSMADMCQTMMQREMAMMPFWMTAFIVLGSLLVVALVLFIILEVQWIRFWNVRIKTERKNLRDSR